MMKTSKFEVTRYEVLTVLIFWAGKYSPVGLTGIIEENIARNLRV